MVFFIITWKLKKMLILFFLNKFISTFLFLFIFQLLRKRHIGNDIVTIVFQEPGALPFTPQTVRSQFQHVFVIVRVINPNSDSARYR